MTFSVPLANSGNLTATAVSGNLSSSTPGVTILDGSSAYPAIAAYQMRLATRPAVGKAMAEEFALFQPA